MKKNLQKLMLKRKYLKNQKKIKLISMLWSNLKISQLKILKRKDLNSTSICGKKINL